MGDSNFNWGNVLRGGMEGFVAGLPDGARVVQALRTAAAQQDELVQRKRQFDIEQGMRQAQQDRESQQQGFQNTMQLNSAGAQPVVTGADNQSYAPSTGSPVPGAPGVTTGMMNPLGPNDNVVTAPGSTNRYRLPSQDERNQADLIQKVNEAKAVEGARQFNLALPGPLGDMLGLPHGSTVTVQHAPTAEDYGRMGEVVNQKQNADTKANAPAKAEKTPDMVDLTPAEQKQFGTTAKQLPLDIYKAKSEHYERVNGKPKAAGDQQKPPSAADIRQIVAKKQLALANSQKQMEQDLSDGALSADGVRQAHVDHVARMQQAQRDYEEQLGDAYGKDVGHNDWADKEMDQLAKGSPTGQPGGQQSGAPNGRGSAQPTGGAKTSPKQPEPASPAQPAKFITMQGLQKYAKDRNMSLADAAKAAGNAGLTFNLSPEEQKQLETIGMRFK